MTPDDPRHGTRAGYLAGCRSENCTRAHTRWMKAYKLAAERNGGRTQIDPAPIRAHILTLLSRMTLGGIAALSGSSASHLRNILDGQHPTMRADLAARLLAISIDTPSGSHHVDPTGARRRLQALALLGFGFERLARMVDDCSAFNLREIAYGNRTRITSDHEQAIRVVFDRLVRDGRPYAPSNRHERAGAARIIQRAQRAGWVSALAWDGNSIDDPNARPVGIIDHHRAKQDLDEAAILQRINGVRTAKTRGAENVEVVRRMLAAGWTQSGIRRHTGLKVERYINQASLGRAA